jgi:hypothetical protein
MDQRIRMTQIIQEFVAQSATLMRSRNKPGDI